MEKWCDYLHWSYIAKAVLLAFRENQGGRMDVPPLSDQWAMHSGLREDLFRRVRQRWCALTDSHWTDFPYSVDGVVGIYMRYRKRTEAELASYEAEIERAING